MMIWLLLAVPLAPLAAAALLTAAAAGGRALARRAGWLVAIGCATSLACLLWLGPAARTMTTTWARPGGLALTVGLHLDSLSWPVAVLVAAIALLVMLYAIGYMRRAEEDVPDQARFFAWMGVFAGAMLALVLASSLLLLFVAWELVGLASFALIGFHYRTRAGRDAARKAFLVTRLGDMGLLLAWLLALLLVGTTEIGALLQAVPHLAIPAAVLAALCLAAALGKSAQLPLTMWLPDAMVGPTPVSALIHSATMVAAGVYLVLRLFPLFDAAPGVLHALAWIGAATALLAALVATAHHDLKRILAWSTISQLGEMMLALGLAVPAAAAAHLATHAVFKSGLFLAAGMVDQAMGTRDLRSLGGLARRMPGMAIGLTACALALAGLPPLAGYWSEHRILAGAVARGPGWAAVLVLLVLLAGLYIGRAAAAVLLPWSRPQAKRAANSASAGDATPVQLVPLLVLAAGAMVMGWIAVEPLAHLLPFALPQTKPGWGWTLAMIAASVTGLGAGAWRVRGHGPVAVLGAWPLQLAHALDRATRAPATAALAIARALTTIEAALDRGARAAAGASLTIARALAHAERGIDRGARAAAGAGVACARGVDTAEARGFAAGADHLAGGLLRGGQQLRRLESGKVYLYALGLFAWVLLAVLAIAIVWIARQR